MRQRKRAADGAARDILGVDRGPCQSVEPVAVRQRVEALGQEEPAHRPVKVVAARPRDDVEDAAARAPELGAEQPRLHGDLLDGVLVVYLVGRAGDGDVVVLRAVNQVVVAARALAVDGELRGVAELRAAGRGGDAGEQAAQVVRVERRGGEVLHLRGREVAAAHRLVLLEDFARRGRNVNHDFRRPDLQLRVNRGDVVRLNLNARVRHGLEAGGADRQVVVAEVNRVEAVEAVFVRRGRALLVGGLVDYLDARAGDHSARGVFDDAVDSPAARLREGRCPAREHQQQGCRK